MSAKTKRKRLTFDEKRKVLAIFSNGSTLDEVALMYGVSTRFTRRLRKNGPNGLKQIEFKTQWKERKARSHGHFEKIELEVFVTQCRSVKFLVTREIACMRALIVRDNMLSKNLLDDEKRNKLSNFSALDGWSTNFTRRYIFKSKFCTEKQQALQLNNRKKECPKN